ncbi:NTP transferase domain-containing protein [Candidatus Saccharibacteria bacterium]|nr:NTP transferase domain-containing protein [Candidatus Saccharibacteria bacterium]
MKRPTKAIITDAGFASRYLPITKTVPKAMLPIGSKPIMQLVVEECVQAGIREIIIVATPEGKPIYEDYFYNSVPRIRKQLEFQGKDERYDLVREVLDLPKIIVIEQNQSLPYGNGSPVASARNYIADDEAFLVLYSDDVVFGKSDALSLMDAFDEHPDALAIVVAQEVDAGDVEKYGIFQLKDGNKLDYIVEKPAANEAPSTLASYGRYLLTPEVFTHLDPSNLGLDDELWTVDAITKLTKTGDVYVVPTEGKWMTTGDPRNYIATHVRYVLDNEPYADEIKEMLR